MLGRLLICASLAACGVPRMLDLDGRPIERPGLVAVGEGIWLVVDSSAPWPRAVLELYLEPPDPWGRLAPLPPLELSLGPARRLAPQRLASQPVACGPAVAAQPGEGPTRDRNTVLIGFRSCRLLRAEFRLARMPTVSDKASVAIGRRAARLRWKTRSDTAEAVAHR